MKDNNNITVLSFGYTPKSYDLRSYEYSVCLSEHILERDALYIQEEIREFANRLIERRSS